MAGPRGRRTTASSGNNVKHAQQSARCHHDRRHGGCLAPRGYDHAPPRPANAGHSLHLRHHLGRLIRTSAVIWFAIFFNFGPKELFDWLLKLRTPFWSKAWCHLRRAIDFARLRLARQSATAVNSRVRRCRSFCSRGGQRRSGSRRGDWPGQLRFIFRQVAGCASCERQNQQGRRRSHDLYSDNFFGLLCGGMLRARHAPTLSGYRL